MKRRPVRRAAAFLMSVLMLAGVFFTAQPAMASPPEGAELRVVEFGSMDGRRQLGVELAATEEICVGSISGTMNWECLDSAAAADQLSMVSFETSLGSGELEESVQGTDWHRTSFHTTHGPETYYAGEVICRWIFQTPSQNLECGFRYKFTFEMEECRAEFGLLPFDHESRVVYETVNHLWTFDGSVSAGTTYQGFRLREDGNGGYSRADACYCCVVCGQKNSVTAVLKRSDWPAQVAEEGNTHYAIWIDEENSLDGNGYDGFLDITLPALAGWKKENGKWYYYGPDKQKKTGWLKDNGKWYLLGPDGAMKTGWQYSSGKWYLLGQDGVMKTGWQFSSGKWYLLGQDGAMKTGWQLSSGKWYYLGSDGAMKTGWFKDGGNWYYLGTDGVMRTGWQTIDGHQYCFKSNGIMCSNEWFQGYWFNASGTWTYPYRAAWHQDSRGWWYGDSSGWYAKNETLKIDNTLYTFGADGYLK